MTHNPFRAAPRSVRYRGSPAHPSQAALDAAARELRGVLEQALAKPVPPTAKGFRSKYAPPLIVPIEATPTDQSDPLGELFEAIEERGK